MREMKLKKGESILIASCKLAETFFPRFMGLMGKKHLPEDEAVAFPKCNSIHTFFMRMPIDVVFVSNEGKVVQVFSSLKPWRLLFPQKGAKHVVEFAANRARTLGIELGDTLSLEGVF